MKEKAKAKDFIMVLRLAKNDFKAKFAGSYMGILWTFLQPVVMILVYWFVFEKGLPATGVTTKAGITIPFVLWLTAGMVPWFYFSEAFSSGTNTLLEYSYLVKKVVFRIDVLPLVKVISSGVVHVILIVVMLVLYACYGFFPDLFSLQVIYYSLSMVFLVLGAVYITCSIVVFFRDMSQIVNIFMQVWVWVTPIMWNLDGMVAAGSISPIVAKIFRLNPFYYIVSGYRDALIYKTGFWEKPALTIYFWAFAILQFLIGRLIFKRLKVHFADVL
jgi:teichoic acid transport system permease protein